MTPNKVHNSKRHSRFGLRWNRADRTNEPRSGMRYCTRAAFWLERNTQAFEAAPTVLGGHGPPPADAPCSAQNSCTRSSSGFSWSRSPGKYCPFSSQPSTNAISPPVRQSTFTCLIVTSMIWSGSATKYTPHTVAAPSEGSSGSARSADSTPGVIQWAPCLDVDLTGGSLTNENSPSSDVTCIQSAGNGFGREEQNVIVVSRCRTLYPAVTKCK
uniref:Uncharacterized protein n=1 Tax=Anopheles coluzzii TaxID=1518534 RepID=A0A8W7PQY8_ANOCL